MTQFAAIARVPTDWAGRYLQQLCKHWAHILAVEYSDAAGTITFPHDARGADWPGAGVVTLAATDTALTCRIDATAAGQRDGLKGALERHLNRFAFREGELAFDWHDG